MSAMPKLSTDQLAIFGGPASFSETLHVGRPNIGDRGKFMARMNDLLDRAWLTNNGPYVQELEQRISELTGAKHCVAMCNATIGLEIAIRALGMTGEVIVPSFTFVATAHALQWQEITPVFCDIDPRTHNLDPAQIERMITPRTTGILGVHVWGRSCDVDALMDIARRHNLKVLFDAAHAFACSYKSTMVGNFGDAEVFSFHATKFFNSFEGGAVVTNDDALAQKIRLMRNFGFVGYDDVEYVGTNGKMSEPAAAMGLTSLEHLTEFVDINRRNYEQYRLELANVPGIKIIEYDATELNNYQYIVLEVDERSTGLSRDDLQQVLWAEHVQARRYFYPGCHQLEPYRSYFPHAGLLLPETERLTQRVLSLPNGTGIDADGIRMVGQLIRFAIAHAAEIRTRLHVNRRPTVVAAEEADRPARTEAVPTLKRLARESRNGDGLAALAAR